MESVCGLANFVGRKHAAGRWMARAWDDDVGGGGSRSGRDLFGDEIRPSIREWSA